MKTNFLKNLYWPIIIIGYLFTIMFFYFTDNAKIPKSISSHLGFLQGFSGFGFVLFSSFYVRITDTKLPNKSKILRSLKYVLITGVLLNLAITLSANLGFYYSKSVYTSIMIIYWMVVGNFYGIIQPELGKPHLGYMQDIEIARLVCRKQGKLILFGGSILLFFIWFTNLNISIWAILIYLLILQIAMLFFAKIIFKRKQKTLQIS
jgi:hypothetical protein